MYNFYEKIISKIKIVARATNNPEMAVHCYYQLYILFSSFHKIIFFINL